MRMVSFFVQDFRNPLDSRYLRCGDAGACPAGLAIAFLEILVLQFSKFCEILGAGWVEALGFRVGVLVEGQRRLETGKIMFLRILFWD